MKITVRDVYNFFPQPIKTISASVFGYYLKWWRYNSKTDKYVCEAFERETWDSEKWKIWQENQLEIILDSAAKKVPYYREYWMKQRIKGNRSNINDINNWPILRKETLRTNPLAFISDGCNVKKMYKEHTSGTTGKPINVWWSRDTVIRWYALFEARVRNWHGVSRNNRWAILGGQIVKPVDEKKPPFWVWNQGLNQLYLSVFHLNKKNIKYYLDALEKYKIEYIFGYSSALESLAYFTKMNNFVFPIEPKIVISNAEPLYNHQRELMQNTFGCKISSTYGMTEIVATGSECEHFNMHLWPEVGFLEILPLKIDANYDDNKTGNLISTGLFNRDMPLIRYETGDIIQLESIDVTCACGRRLPLVKKIIGRVDDVIITPDGRRFGRLDPIFKERFPIIEAQIIQENISEILVLYVPGQEFTNSTEVELQKHIKEYIGSEMNIKLKSVKQISRDKNGKFKAVISKLSKK